MNRNKYVLPFSIPMEMTWQSQSILHAMLGQSPKSYSWVMNYFIQYYSETVKEPEFNHPYSCFVPGINNNENITSCPFIEFDNVTKEQVMKDREYISEFLIDKIDEEKYIQIDLDQHGIWSDDVEVGKSIHGNFFYGYDKGKKEFYIADHFDYGKFSTKRVSFGIVNEAFEVIRNTEKYKDIRLFKFKEVEYEFDYDVMKGFFNDLYNSENTYNAYEYFIHKNDVVLGLDTYNNYIKYLENVSTQYGNYIDRRSFTLLLNHKEVMSKRLEFFKNNIKKDKKSLIDEFINEYNEIVENVRTILYATVKYNFSKSDRVLRRIIEQLKTTREKERIVLEKIISSLDQIIDALEL